MDGIRRMLAVAFVAGLAWGEAPAAAEEGPPKPAPRAAPEGPKASPEKLARVRKFLEAYGWVDRTVESLLRPWAWAESDGKVPRGFCDRCRVVASREKLLQAGTESWAARLDDATLDALVAFFESPAGKSLREKMATPDPALDAALRHWSRSTGMAAMEAMTHPPGAAVEDLPGLETAFHERAAVKLLRHIAERQAAAKASARIDADGDGTGEYGTLLELSGGVPVRTRGAGGAAVLGGQGAPVKPRVLPSSMGAVDAQGILRLHGYCIRAYLPDAGSPAGFVHETGPREMPGLAGGSGSVGVDASESAWCAYAWPEKHGASGNRVFFVNQAGVVLASDNGKAKWEGGGRPVPPDAALSGPAITDAPAAGAAGRDGEVWEVVKD